MTDTLVILAHPNIQESKVNKRWKEELEKYADKIEIHELYKEAFNGKFDVEKEQKLLEKYDKIILQFPVYWYSYPPLLKKWFDDVFTHGWAYGSKGKKLYDKTFGVALAIGDKEVNYSRNGNITFTVSELLAPLKATTIHVGAKLFPHFCIFGASFQASKEEIDKSAKKYIEYISELSNYVS